MPDTDDKGEPTPDVPEDEDEAIATSDDLDEVLGACDD